MSINNHMQARNLNTERPTGIKKQWLHGVRYITCNHIGDIYWKGRHIDMISDPGNVKYYEYVRELGRNCEYLESMRIPVNIKTAVFYIDWFKEININEPYKKLLIRCPDIRIANHKILFLFSRAACEFDGQKWQYFKLPDRLSNEWEKSWSQPSLEEKGYKGISSSHSDVSSLIDCFKRYKVPTTLLDLMAEKLYARGKK